MRRQLTQTDDDDERYALDVELGRRHRAMALAPRARPDHQVWQPIPQLTYRWPTVGWTDDRRRDDLKSFMRVLATAVAGTLGAVILEQAFVVLVRYAHTPEEMDVMVTCPHPEPINAIRAFVEGAREPDSALVARAERLDVEHRYGILDGQTVPLVVALPEPDRVVLMNRHHLQDPAQFLRAELCTTTSGFLNFLGALCIGPGQPAVFTDIDLLPDDTLGEWKRWFYAHLDSGIVFDAERLLVNKHDAERYAYDYQEGDEL